MGEDPSSNLGAALAQRKGVDCIYGDSGIERLNGKKVNSITWSEDNLTFGTDQGPIGFMVEGDCCSHSYFHDFYGVAWLLNNGPIVAARSIALRSDDITEDYGCIQCYGFELVTEHPQFGEVTSVFSFRNSSNGYYGGWMESTDYVDPDGKLITADVVGSA